MLVNGLTKIDSNQIAPENCEDPMKVNLENEVDETKELKELPNCNDAVRLQMSGMRILFIIYQLLVIFIN